MSDPEELTEQKLDAMRVRGVRVRDDYATGTWFHGAGVDVIVLVAEVRRLRARVADLEQEVAWLHDTADGGP